MKFINKLRRDYLSTWDAWMSAVISKDKDLAHSLSKDLVKITDAIEREK